MNTIDLEPKSNLFWQSLSISPLWKLLKNFINKLLK